MRAGVLWTTDLMAERQRVMRRLPGLAACGDRNSLTDLEAHVKASHRSATHRTTEQRDKPGETGISSEVAA